MTDNERNRLIEVLVQTTEAICVEYFDADRDDFNEYPEVACAVMTQVANDLIPFSKEAKANLSVTIEAGQLRHTIECQTTSSQRWETHLDIEEEPKQRKRKALPARTA